MLRKIPLVSCIIERKADKKSLKIIDHQVLQRLMVISFARNEIDKGIGSRMMLSSDKYEFLILYQLYSLQSIYEANKKMASSLYEEAFVFQDVSVGDRSVRTSSTLFPLS